MIFEFRAILLGILVFMLGFFSYALLSSGINLEKPFSAGFFSSNIEPSDFISQEQIKVYSDRVVIQLKYASLSSYADTGSMKPVFGKNANGIRIVPKNENEINIGDIVSFDSGNGLIVHRVVEKGRDNEGVYFITKGDNNNETDGKIRFNDIKYVTIGVLW